MLDGRGERSELKFFCGGFAASTAVGAASAVSVAIRPQRAPRCGPMSAARVFYPAGICFSSCPLPSEIKHFPH